MVDLVAWNKVGTWSYSGMIWKRHQIKNQARIFPFCLISFNLNLIQRICVSSFTRTYATVSKRSNLFGVTCHLCKTVCGLIILPFTFHAIITDYGWIFNERCSVLVYPGAKNWREPWSPETRSCSSNSYENASKYRNSLMNNSEWITTGSLEALFLPPAAHCATFSI